MKPQKSVCLKCQKDQHSEKLWEMHELAVSRDDTVLNTAKRKTCIQSQCGQQEGELQGCAGLIANHHMM